jgi:hypothetical protein
MTGLQSRSCGLWRVANVSLYFCHRGDENTETETEDSIKTDLRCGGELNYDRIVQITDFNGGIKLLYFAIKALGCHCYSRLVGAKQHVCVYAFSHFLRRRFTLLDEAAFIGRRRFTDDDHRS